jgi:hypothetical protein
MLHVGEGNISQSFGETWKGQETEKTCEAKGRKRKDQGDIKRI